MHNIMCIVWNCVLPKKTGSRRVERACFPAYRWTPHHRAIRDGHATAVRSDLSQDVPQVMTRMNPSDQGLHRRLDELLTSGIDHSRCAGFAECF